MRVINALAGAVALILVVPVHASADGNLIVVDEVGATDETDDPPDVPVVCSTRELIVSRVGRYESSGFVFIYVDTLYLRVDPESGESWVRVSKICRRGDELVSSEVMWLPIEDPDPELVAGVLRDRQAREIADPVPLLSPVGPGYVNLGMWLAVDDPGPYSVTASATSGSWVTARAVLAETVFEMGNGDVVRCVGAGDPIPESAKSSVEASPVCGYTFRSSNGGEPYVVTITSTWEVSWTSSRGVSGVQPPIVVSTSVPYQVLEIQTVGSG